MAKILLPLACGFEEIELVSIADVLRRGGVEVILASLDSALKVKGAHNISIIADTSLQEIKPNEFGAIALHGGMEGVQNMLASPTLLQITSNLASSHKLIGAICAAPLVLDELHLLTEDFCCYPECEKMMKHTQAQRLDLPCKTSDHIITGTGPAFAISFALEILKSLEGESKAQEVQKQLLL